ncbi:MAG: PorP/SprF family type IX secretion system membrane protein [Bacteroidia bacterium]
MKKIVTYFSLMLVLGSGKLFSQQLPLFTNYLFNAYAFNPAVVGSNPYIQANLNYRNQWTGFDGAPKTYMASIYGPFRKSTKVAMGGMIMSDVAGLFQRTAGYFTYAYHVKLNDKWKLGMALSAGVAQYRVKLYDVRAYDKDDELLTGNVISKMAFDANAGLYVYRNNFFAGLSGYQVADNKINFAHSGSRQVPHMYLMTGYTYKVNKKFDLQPSVLLKYASPSVQPEISLKAIYRQQLWMGLSYRMNDAYSFMLGVVCKERINIAYAYDLPFSGIRKYTSGSHEIMFTYAFKKTKKQQDLEEEEFNTIDNGFKSNLRNKKKAKPQEEQK